MVNVLNVIVFIILISLSVLIFKSVKLIKKAEVLLDKIEKQHNDIELIIEEKDEF